MPFEPTGPVVVGVDGSPGSLLALDLAAEEAVARVVTLVVLHGYQGRLRRTARLLDVADAQVASEHPGLAVQLVAHSGGPAEALVAWSRHACLLVVGHHQHRLVAGEPPARSVASQVAGRTGVPVLVHRHLDTWYHGPPPRPVLVGIAASSHMEQVVEFAFAEAALRGAPLLAAHVRTRAGAFTPAELALAEAVARWSEKYPAVRVTWRLRHGVDVPVALAAASRSAQVAVVGAARHPFGLRPGSVSDVLVERAGCPVAVVPAG